jgi:hypothetical protein
MEIKQTHKQNKLTACAEEWPIQNKKRTKIKSTYNIHPSLLLLQTRPNTKDMEIKHTHKQTQTYRLRRRMTDPSKNKKRSTKKIQHGKSLFRPQQKQQQNITSYPSLLLLQTAPNTKDMEIKHIHKQTQTYGHLRRMADPGENKKKTKIKIEHGKLMFRPQKKQNITSYPSLLLLQKTRPNTKDMEIKNTHKQKQQQNITSYSSLLLLQTRPNTKDMEIKHTHKQTQTYILRRRMADPRKNKKRKTKKIELGKLK